ncbi:MAG TPA: AbrB/MazE/SpoVT family DNA-binding domain-containing protein [Clostridia bacterium]|nr:AbrB/MazE/SpoVT family DNA-binding domain-containing protein [Clostridia bacterium]
MSATRVRQKRRITLPRDVCEAAGIKPNDQVEWRFEDGEIRGRKLACPKDPQTINAKLVKKGDALVMDIPKGYKLDPDAIARAVREERDSRA